LFREFKGKRIEVFRVGEVAKMIGANASVIRRYERQGAIPMPSFPGEHRLYAKHQVGLISEICNFKRNTRYSWRRPQKATEEKKLIARVKVLWEKGL
jgi:DNA-binding transcriptional MerR regulator